MPDLTPDPTKLPSGPDQPQRSTERIATERRRLLKGGAAAAPILMAFTSRAALGSCGVCTSPSRHASLNQFNSAHPGEQQYSCTGRSPGYYKTMQNLDGWPSGVTIPVLKKKDHGNWVSDTNGTPPFSRFCAQERMESPGASFISIFGNADTMGPVVPTGSACAVASRPVCLWEILAYPTHLSTSYAQLARHLIAGYFNALTISNYPVTAAQIIDMWNNRTGYCPTSGCTAPWSASDIIDYLVCTFDGQDIDYRP